jgi:hypothetical protein
MALRPVYRLTPIPSQQEAPAVGSLPHADSDPTPIPLIVAPKELYLLALGRPPRASTKRSSPQPISALCDFQTPTLGPSERTDVRQGGCLEESTRVRAAADDGQLLVCELRLVPKRHSHDGRAASMSHSAAGRAHPVERTQEDCIA